jgi:hypothetical protein
MYDCNNSTAAVESVHIQIDTLIKLEWLRTADLLMKSAKNKLKLVAL